MPRTCSTLADRAGRCLGTRRFPAPPYRERQRLADPGTAARRRGHDLAPHLARRGPSAGRRHAQEPARRARRPCRLRRRRELRLRAGHRRLGCWNSASGYLRAPCRLVEPTSSCSAAGRPPSPAWSTSPPRSGASTDPLTVAHAGAYFETASLLASWPQRMMRPDRRRGGGRHRHRRTGVVRRTVRLRRRVCRRHVTPSSSTSRWPGRRTICAAPAIDCPLVIAYSSGLKLDQAGLELANVGIVRVLSRDGDVREVGTALRQLRGLTGAGLTLDELSALSAPWFMDRAYADRYIGSDLRQQPRARRGDRLALAGLRRALSSVARRSPAAEAPFCALTLNEPSRKSYRALEARIARECDRRGLLVTKGGSFGFRGHRFELIEPEDRARPSCAWRWAGATAGAGKACASCSPSSLRADRSAAAASST